MNNITKDLMMDIDSEWMVFMDEQINLPYFNLLLKKLEKEYQTKFIYPEVYDILKPMKLSKLNDIKVIVIGQDPYHTPYVADGLAFSSKQNKIPPSLKNIFIEIKADVGIDNIVPDLSLWAKQGVFLLNTVLTVEKGKAKSHSKIGWNDFVVNLIKYLDNNDEYVFVLWGNDAQKYQKYLNNAHVITGFHPSPLAQGKFFNGKYFSRINECLRKQNKDIIDWRTSNDF